MIDTRGLKVVTVGCTGGSGSRLLRDILEASPQIFMDRDYSPNSKDSQKSKSFLELKDPGPEIVKRLIDEFMQTILAQIPMGEETRYKYFGWKNPRTRRYADLLLHEYPDLRFLHLVRNPAVIARGSLWKRGFKRRVAMNKLKQDADRDELILTRWANQNLPMWKKYRDHPNYLMVRYEDIVNRPQQSVELIFDWLDIADYDMNAALAAIAPPADAMTRGHDVDVSIIAEAIQQLGYDHRLS